MRKSCRHVKEVFFFFFLFDCDYLKQKTVRSHFKGGPPVDRKAFKQEEEENTPTAFYFICQVQRGEPLQKFFAVITVDGLLGLNVI